jgi:hypothetical protein
MKIDFGLRLSFRRLTWEFNIRKIVINVKKKLFIYQSDIEVAIGGFAVIIDIFFLVNLNLGSYILGFLIFSDSVERHVKLHSLQIYISHSLPTGD